jgi:hypothetical protein
MHETKSMSCIAEQGHCSKKKRTLCHIQLFILIDTGTKISTSYPWKWLSGDCP